MNAGLKITSAGIAGVLLAGCVPQKELASVPGARVLMAYADAFQEGANPGFLDRRRNAQLQDYYRGAQGQIAELNTKVHDIEMDIRAQNPGSARLKILRLSQDDLRLYSIPHGNMFPSGGRIGITGLAYTPGEFRGSDRARDELRAGMAGILNRLVMASAAAGEATQNSAFLAGVGRARGQADQVCQRAANARRDALRHLAADRAEVTAWNAANVGRTWTETVQMPGRSGSVMAHPFGGGVGAPFTGATWVNIPGEVVTQTHTVSPRRVPVRVLPSPCDNPQFQASVQRAARVEGAIAAIPSLRLADEWRADGSELQPMTAVLREINRALGDDPARARWALYEY